MNTARSIAYFSMEIGLEEGMPTYSGGLGVLAGDTIRSAADLSIPLRQQCVFTTHTPVPAGHDQFSLDLVQRVLGYREAFHTMHDVFCCEGVLNMTYLALNLSHYINGVAKKHREVSQHMFARYTIHYLYLNDAID